MGEHIHKEYFLPFISLFAYLIWEIISVIIFFE